MSKSTKDRTKKILWERWIALIVQTIIINRNKVFCIGLLPESELG